MGTRDDEPLWQALQTLLDDSASDATLEQAAEVLSTPFLKPEQREPLVRFLESRESWRPWELALVLWLPSPALLPRYLALFREPEVGRRVEAMESAECWERSLPRFAATIEKALLSVTLGDDATARQAANYYLERWRRTESAADLASLAAITRGCRCRGWWAEFDEFMTDKERIAVHLIFERDHGLYSPSLPPLPYPARHITLRWRGREVSPTELRTLRRFSTVYANRQLSELLAELRQGPNHTLVEPCLPCEEAELRADLEALGFLLEPAIPPSDEELQQEAEWLVRRGLEREFYCMLTGRDVAWQNVPPTISL